MKIQEARELGDQLAYLVSLQQLEKAHNLLNPVLADRTPFRILDAIGMHLGNEPLDVIDAFLEQIASQRTMGGWIVIASALRAHAVRSPQNLPEVLNRCTEFVITANVWYAADSFAERVPGSALVAHFETALPLITAWRTDPNRWVRRMVGVSVHYWAKQAHGAEKYQPRVSDLLDLLSPLFSENNLDTVKGTGWGLKTLGRYYPDIVADWLIQQAGRSRRELMLKKATTYLPPELRQRVFEKQP